MQADQFASSSQPLTAAEIADLTDAFYAGKLGASDRLFALLSHHAAITARDLLGSGVAEIDDIVQDTVMAVLDYLKRRAEFHGDLVNFTISVARNRCRNYVVWRRYRRADSVDDLAEYLSNPDRSPLETLLADEEVELLQEAVDGLDPACQRLLHALYHENRRIEDLQAQEGLKSVQSVYHRRAMCLKKVTSLLKNRLFICSSPGGIVKSRPARNRRAKQPLVKRPNEEQS